MLNEFLNDARQYAAARGISLTTLGVYSVADSRLFARLLAGGQCMPRTIERVRQYMAAHPVPYTPNHNESSHEQSENQDAA